ncbi:MAG: hypothetical protein R3E50_15240 [Halioglobus sp.]
MDERMGSRERNRDRSRGAALLLALLFTLLLAAIAGVVLQAAALQLRMAGNDQFLEEALQQARAIATELSLNPAHFSLADDVGHTRCPAGSVAAGCDDTLLQVPASAAAPAGVEVDYRVSRQEPLLWRGFPARESEGTVSSSLHYDTAMFEISVRIDGSGKRLGRVHIVQGIALRVPRSH